MPQRFWIYSALVFGGVWILAAGLFGIAQNDYGPIWYALVQLREGHPIYGAAATADLTHFWVGTLPGNQLAGNGYPLPLIIAMIPLSLLPYKISMAVMSLGVLAALLWLFHKTAPQHTMRWVATILSSAMFFQTVLIGNVSTVWFFLLVWLCFAARQEQWTVIGILAPLVALKPQIGLVVAVWALGVLVSKRQWRGLLGAAAVTFLLLASSYWLSPAWLYDWMAHVQTIYVAQLNPVHAPWWVWILLIAGYKKPWWVAASLLTVLVMPHVAYYSLMPLTIYWLDRGGRLVVVAGVLQWMYFFNSALVWPLVVFPIMLAVMADYRTRDPGPADRHTAGDGTPRSATPT
jgi:hypothetical protein